MNTSPKYYLSAVALAALVGATAVTLTAEDEKTPAKKAVKKEAAKKETPKPAAGGATFELYKDSAGEFRFRMRDDDGSLLCSSGKGYKTKPDAVNVIDAIRRTAAKAGVEDQAK